MKLGYARVSTEDQRLEIQRTRLTEAGCGRLFEERISAPPVSDRPWSGCSRSCAPRTSWSSLGSTAWHARPRSCSASPRSSPERTRDYSRSRSLGRIRPRLPGCMVLTVFAGVAEFERALIRHRTDEGRQAAKRRGVSFGRPRKLRPDQKALALALVQEGRSISEVALNLQRSPRNHPSLPQRAPGQRSCLMTVHRPAQTHGPGPAAREAGGSIRRPAFGVDADGSGAVGLGPVATSRERAQNLSLAFSSLAFSGVIACVGTVTVSGTWSAQSSRIFRARSSASGAPVG